MRRQDAPRKRPFPLWRPGLAWLLVLGPLFFLSYGATNQRAAALPDVPSIVFDWERHIPLWPWTILPYWSIDLFYGLSLLICRTRLELKRHGLRLLTAQLVCVVAFFAVPLRFSTPRLPVEGWAGALFDALAAFDLPYNQAPSLHIVLLLILWDFYRRHTRGLLRAFVHVWSALIGLSVLTTYQHHFIDVPTGLLTGLLCLWLWPLEGDRPAWRWSAHPARRRLALLYLGGALLFAALALAGGRGARWWLLWPAASLALVALCYAALGAAGFQKQPGGRHALATRWLMAPYRLGAWINARLWTWRAPSPSHVAGRVWLGRLPLPWEAGHGRFSRVLDLSAELSCRHPGVQCVPMLDLVEPEGEALLAAARAIERLSRDNDVLVCCALGYSRSAAAVATWLCTNGRARSVAEAVEMLRRARPRVVLKPALIDTIERAVSRAVAANSATAAGQPVRASA